MNRLQVGIIGAGVISGRYIQNLKSVPFIEKLFIADQDASRAKNKGTEFDIPSVAVQTLLDDPCVDLIVNLTPPKAHADVSRMIIEAGKHVYSEKPLAVTRDAGEDILTRAETHRVRVGCAPDTFLGGGLQTCRKLIDDGWVGTATAGVAFMMGHGHESWHPDPAFFYEEGGGPLFDMGPYYLTALVALLGPIRRVSGAARASFAERIITSAPRRGEIITVKTPTHVAATVEFVQGPIVTLVTSFDVWPTSLPSIEIYGSEGTLSVPDPNDFGGPVRIRRGRESEWHDMPILYGFTDDCRGLGVADMAYGIMHNLPHRAHGQLAYHVLEAMDGILQAASSGRHYDMKSRITRPDPLEPSGWGLRD
ncbi:MAG: oxidoreductase [Sulfobacillus acidophilus]|uniref:Oxidoreductase n=1 Tax=Sulfobacillus acidophilus TaxID=53633 RepID=A0A2T2WJM0_9FIRM|nr:MAG: oxidoreductase [Sulfobacillus acidophilus]